MARTSTNKVERLMEAAKVLIHQQGLAQTTLADIARKSGVPLGNVYYYFKTKDEIAAAVIKEYKDTLVESLRELETKESDPKKRLTCFVKAMGGYKEEIASHGCPVGSLCQELNKETTALAAKADGIFTIEVEWVAAQFKLMGHKDAADLAVHLVATLQGVSLLANAMKSPGLVGRQLTRVLAWIEQQ